MATETPNGTAWASNPALSAAAISGLTNPAFEKKPGMCQRFVRQAIQRAHGNRFDRFHLGTAELSRRAWINGGYSVEPKNGSVIGDILYKKATSGQPEGHVGIRISGNRVAENSTRSAGRISGGKGIVSLAEFGHVDTIVRLSGRK